MAELLFRNVDNTNPDPIKNVENCYKRDDLVLSYPDKHIWGRMESKIRWLLEGRPEEDWPNRFYIIKMPDLIASIARQFAVPIIFGDKRRSMYRIVRSALPESIMIPLALNGEHTIKYSQMRGFIRSKIDESTI